MSINKYRGVGLPSEPAPSMLKMWPPRGWFSIIFIAYKHHKGIKEASARLNMLNENLLQKFYLATTYHQTKSICCDNFP